MRQRSAVIAIAVAALVVLGSGCNPDRNKLFFKPQTGAKRSVEVEDAMSYSMKAMGREIGFGLSRENAFDLETQSVEPDGSASLKVTCHPRRTGYTYVRLRHSSAHG